MLPDEVFWIFLLWGSLCSQFATAFDYHRIPRPIPVERELRPLPTKQPPEPVPRLAPVNEEYIEPQTNSMRPEPYFVYKDRYDKVPRPVSGQGFTESNLLPSGNTLIDNSFINREESQSDPMTSAKLMTTSVPLSSEINNAYNSQSNQPVFEENFNTTDVPPVTVQYLPETTTLKLILDTETPTQYRDVLESTESSKVQECDNDVHPHSHLQSIFTEPDDRILINGIYYCPCIPAGNLRELSKSVSSQQDEFEDIEIKSKTAINSQTTTSIDLVNDFNPIEEKVADIFVTETTTPLFYTSTPSTNVIVEEYTKNSVIKDQSFQARDFNIPRPSYFRNENIITNSDQYEALNYTTEESIQMIQPEKDSLSSTMVPASSIELKPDRSPVTAQPPNNDLTLIPRPESSNLIQSVVTEKADSVSSMESKSVSSAVNSQQSNNDFKVIPRPESSNVTQSIESVKGGYVTSIESKSNSKPINIQQSNNIDFKIIPRPGSSNLTQSMLSPTNEVVVKPIDEIDSSTIETPASEPVSNISTEENKLNDEINFGKNNENKEKMTPQEMFELELNQTSKNTNYYVEEKNDHFLSDISKQEANQNYQSSSSNIMATKSLISKSTSQFSSRQLHEVPRPIPSSQPYQAEIMMPTTTEPSISSVIPPYFGKLDNSYSDSSDNLSSQSDQDMLSAQGIETINPNAELDTGSDFLSELDNLEQIETTSETIFSSNAQETSSDGSHLDDTETPEFKPPLENDEDSVALNTPSPMDLNINIPTSSNFFVPQHSTATQQPTFTVLDKKYCSLVGDGIFASEDDCESYIRCHEGIATKMDCPKGLVFNPNITTCDWPQSVPTCNPAIFKNFVCPALKYDEEEIPLKDTINFRYEDSCDLYIACHMSKPRLLRCDPGYSFDPTLRRCIKTELVEGCSKQNDNFKQRIY